MNERISVRVFRRTGRTFYQAEWTDPTTGKITTESTKATTKRAAERYAIQLEKRLEKGIIRAGVTPWAEFRETYIEEGCDGLRESSIAAIEATLNAVERIINPATLQALAKPEILSRFRKGLQSETRAKTEEKAKTTPKKSPATIRRHLRVLRAAFNWAQRAGLLAAVPTMPTVKGAAPSAKSRAITGEEFDRMLAAIPDVVGESRRAEWEFLLKFIKATGLRIGESLQLRWFDGPVALDREKSNWVIRFAAEGQKANRVDVVPLTPEATELLDQETPQEPSGFVLLPSRRSRDPHWPSRRISAIGAKAGVFTAPGKPGSAHDLRRAFATKWANRVMPAALMQLMRHRSTSTTMKFYVSNDTEELAALLARHELRTLSRTLDDSEPVT